MILQSDDDFNSANRDYATNTIINYNAAGRDGLSSEILKTRGNVGKGGG